MKFRDPIGCEWWKTALISKLRSQHFSWLTEHGPVLRSIEDYRNPINYKLPHRPGRSRSTGSLCRICSAACFRFESHESAPGWRLPSRQRRSPLNFCFTGEKFYDTGNSLPSNKMKFHYCGSSNTLSAHRHIISLALNPNHLLHRLANRRYEAL